MRFLALPLCLVVISTAGCPAKVATIEIAPAKVDLRSDTQTRVLTATPKDEAGAAIEGERVTTWSSADVGVVIVDTSGKVKPTGSGTTTVTATIEEKTASVPVTVILLKRIQLQSPAMVIVAGTPSEPLALNFMNERGEQIAPDGQKISWKTADPAVAKVSETGVVTGIAAGSTLLTAEVPPLKAEMTVTVNPPPEAVPAPVPGAPDAPVPTPPTK